MLPIANVIQSTKCKYILFATEDHISQHLYLRGEWMQPLLLITELFTNDDDQALVLDVGANVGSYCIPVAQGIAAKNGLVYAYEPQRVVFYQLCGSTVLNSVGNLYNYNLAIGREDGHITVPELDFFKSTNNGAFSLDADIRSHFPEVTVAAGSSEYPCEQKRLDSIAFPRPITLMKIDVEGLELAVLQGATATLEQSKFPPLLLEAWSKDWFADKKKDLQQHLAHLGYQIFTLGDEIIAQHPGFPKQIEFRVQENQGVTVHRVR